MSERACLEQSLVRTELKLSALQEVVAEVDNTRVQLKRAINQKVPIAILPVDVKLEIFLHAYHDVLPLVLGAVCKEWRDIAWHSPRLWNTINLVLSQDHYKTQIILLGDWLKRGGQCPLSITLHYTRLALLDTVAMWTTYPELPCLELLFEQSYRWEHIDFQVPRDDIYNLIRKPGNLPLLRSLSLDFYLPDEWVRYKTYPRLRYFAEAPLLRSANTNSYDQADIDLPWKQLEVLRYNCSISNLGHFYTILEQAQNLVHFYPHTNLHPHEINQRVRLSKLQSIALSEHSILQIMDLPSLKDLHVGSIYDKLNTDILLNFVRRSFCHITTLHASASDVMGDFISLMRHIPSLRNLHLSVEKSQDELLRDFTKELHPDYTTPLLPSLEVLAYEGWTCFHYAEIVDLLEQRWKKGTSLGGHHFRSFSQFKSVHINSKNAIPGMDDPVIDAKLEILRNEGMDVVITAGEVTAVG